MKLFSKLSALILFAALSSSFAFSDTLSLVSVNGATTPNGGEYVGPYGVTVNGTLENLYCLDLNRNVSFGETWSATPTVLSSSSTTAQKEAVIIYSQLGNPWVNATTVQLELWSILDPSGAEADGLTSSQFDYVQTTVYNEATNGKEFAQYGDAFYRQFTDYIATSPEGGLAQDFIGQSVPVAPTPEPSSPVLLGTGFFGAAGVALRKARATVSQ